MQRETVCHQGEQVVNNDEKAHNVIHTVFPQIPPLLTCHTYQTYGKGNAADCRRHVQKLNMLKGEKEQLENEQIQSNHPPEDYADTFTTQDKQLEEIVSLKEREKKKDL